MLEKLKKIIEEAQKQSVRSVDSSRFDHPLAKKTGWHPLAGGGANFQTHKLDHSNPDILIFKATKGAYAFSVLFIFIGLLGTLIPLGFFFADGMKEFVMVLFAVIFGGVFTAVGVFALYFMTKPRVFDTFYGCYYKGRKKPKHDFESEKKHAITHLAKVKAIQIIPERIRGKNASYFSYEINLVLNDGSRVNVIDHGKHRAVSEDAQILATSLGVPLWDAS